MVLEEEAGTEEVQAGFILLIHLLLGSKVMQQILPIGF